MKNYKKIIVFNLIIMCIFTNIFTVNALAETEEQTLSINFDVGKISPKIKEVTGYKYKYFDGVKYKRLWSYTYNRWIDPEWTLA